MSAPNKRRATHGSDRPSTRALPPKLQAILQAKETTQLLRAQQVAELLNVSINTIRMWIWQKRLPVVRLGRAVRIRREDLEQLIERNREDAVSF